MSDNECPGCGLADILLPDGAEQAACPCCATVRRRDADAPFVALIQDDQEPGERIRIEPMDGDPGSLLIVAERVLPEERANTNVNNVLANHGVIWCDKRMATEMLAALTAAIARMP